MITQTYIPRFPLNQFVDYFFFYEGYNPSHAVERFLPDGNVEFVIDLHDTPKFIYDNDTLKEIQACHHVWASGLRTEPISIDSGREAAMIVVYFKKGLAHPFFPVPMNEIADCVVDADLLWGNWIGSLRERILETSDTTSRFEILEDALLRQFGSRLIQNSCVEYAIRQIILQPDQVSFNAMSHAIGYSQKHFISMFKNLVGTTPKSYLKIARFQKAINEIEQCGSVNWTAISQDCGFYDQSHFINDFRLFSGFTPEQYLRRKTAILNYVPVG
ncbi:MAG TPA: AraC family transcriptional regulator [Pyrinomonadaceae bacterium]|nr:AraC family transcriptional regulator [Pyrinomonadaceae bacterium]